MGYEGLSVRRRIVYAFDRMGDKVFTQEYNPLYWLGTMCFFFLMLITISGIYLFLFYRTSSPYETVQYLTIHQWYLGGIMRSIHRYASDGFVLFMAIHLLREFLLARAKQILIMFLIMGMEQIPSVAVALMGLRHGALNSLYRHRGYRLFPCMG